MWPSVVVEAALVGAGHGVVVVAHHHVAVRRQVIADVVVPAEVVAVAVADDDERQPAHRGDVGREVEVLAAACWPECRSPPRRWRRGCRPPRSRHAVPARGVVHHVEAGFVAEAVDEVAVAQDAVLVAVEHHVVADAEPRAGIRAQEILAARQELVSAWTSAPAKETGRAAGRTSG